MGHGKSVRFSIWMGLVLALLATPTAVLADTTCAGVCGGASPVDACYCDDACTQYQDCCDDYLATCQAEGFEQWGVEAEAFAVDSTCDGYCGGQNAQAGCWCDDACSNYGDCCEDYEESCGVPEPAGSCHPDIGVYACGAHSPDGCWCDESCADYGDCCEDKEEVCAQTFRFIPFDFDSETFAPADDGRFGFNYAHANAISFELTVAAGPVVVRDAEEALVAELFAGQHIVEVAGDTVTLDPGAQGAFSMNAYLAVSDDDGGAKAVTATFPQELQTAALVGDAASVVLVHGPFETAQFSVNLRIDALPDGGALTLRDKQGNSQTFFGPTDGPVQSRTFMQASIFVTLSVGGEGAPLRQADATVVSTTGFHLQPVFSTEGLQRTFMSVRNTYWGAREDEYVAAIASLEMLLPHMAADELSRFGMALGGFVTSFGVEGLELLAMHWLNAVSEAGAAQMAFPAFVTLREAYLQWMFVDGCGYSDANKPTWIAPGPPRLSGVNDRPLVFWALHEMAGVSDLGSFVLLDHAERVFELYDAACLAGLPGLAHPAWVPGVAECGWRGPATPFMPCETGPAAAFLIGDAHAQPELPEDAFEGFGGHGGNGTVEFHWPEPDEQLCDPEERRMEIEDEILTQLENIINATHGALSEYFEAILECIDEKLDDPEVDVCAPGGGGVWDCVGDICEAIRGDAEAAQAVMDEGLPADLTRMGWSPETLTLMAEMCGMLDDDEPAGGEQGGGDSCSTFGFGSGGAFDPESCLSDPIPMGPDGRPDMDAIVSESTQQLFDILACSEAIRRQASEERWDPRGYDSQDFVCHAGVALCVIAAGATGVGASVAAGCALAGWSCGESVFNDGDDNHGNGNTGNNNHGSYNTGNNNTGNNNHGSGNQGDSNHGNSNHGNNNNGSHNNGSQNNGSGNQGNENTGDANRGNGNNGNGNVGNGNSGNGNFGNNNTGNWNYGDNLDCPNGCVQFEDGTIVPTPDDMKNGSDDTNPNPDAETPIPEECADFFPPGTTLSEAVGNPMDPHPWLVYPDPNGSDDCADAMLGIAAGNPADECTTVAYCSADDMCCCGNEQGEGGGPSPNDCLTKTCTDDQVWDEEKCECVLLFPPVEPPDGGCEDDGC